MIRSGSAMTFPKRKISTLIVGNTKLPLAACYQQFQVPPVSCNQVRCIVLPHEWNPIASRGPKSASVLAERAARRERAAVQSDREFRTEILQILFSDETAQAAIEIDFRPHIGHILAREIGRHRQIDEYIDRVSRWQSS